MTTTEGGKSGETTITAKGRVSPAVNEPPETFTTTQLKELFGSTDSNVVYPLCVLVEDQAARIASLEKRLAEAKEAADFHQRSESRAVLALNDAVARGVAATRRAEAAESLYHEAWNECSQWRLGHLDRESGRLLTEQQRRAVYCHNELRKTLAAALTAAKAKETKP